MFPVDNTDHPVRRLAAMFRHIQSECKRLSEAMESAYARKEFDDDREMVQRMSPRWLGTKDYQDSLCRLRSVHSEFDGDLERVQQSIEQAARLTRGISVEIRHSVVRAPKYETAMIAYLREAWDAAASVRNGNSDARSLSWAAHWKRQSRFPNPAEHLWDCAIRATDSRLGDKGDSGAATNPDGPSIKDLRRAAQTALDLPALLGNDTFRKIRDASGLPDYGTGGKAAHKRFSHREIRVLADTAERLEGEPNGSVRGGGAIAREWRRQYLPGE